MDKKKMQKLRTCSPEVLSILTGSDLTEGKGSVLTGVQTQPVVTSREEVEHGAWGSEPDSVCALETDTRLSADRLRGSSFGALGYTFRLGLSKSVFTVAALKPVWSSRKVKSNFTRSVSQEWFYCRARGYIAFNEPFYGIVEELPSRNSFAFFWRSNVQRAELRRKVLWSDFCEFVRLLSRDGCSCLSVEERDLHFDWKQRKCSDLK